MVCGVYYSYEVSTNLNEAYFKLGFFVAIDLTVVALRKKLRNVTILTRLTTFKTTENFNIKLDIFFLASSVGFRNGDSHQDHRVLYTFPAMSTPECKSRIIIVS